MKLFTLHDNATKTYTAPVAIPSERDAIESLRVSANDPKSAHCKHAPDFTLYAIGEWNSESAEIKMYADKQLIVNASALLQGVANGQKISEIHHGDEDN